MPLYEIRVYETQLVSYTVEAADEDDAKKRWSLGKAAPADDMEPEFVCTNVEGETPCGIESVQLLYSDEADEEEADEEEADEEEVPF